MFDVLQSITPDVDRAALTSRFVWAVVVGQLAAALTGAAGANTVQVYLSTLIGERFSTRVKNKLVRELLSRDQAFYDRTPKGELLSRLTNDITTLQNILVDVLGNRGVRSLLEVGGSMIVILFLNTQLALLSLVTVPILSMLTRLVVVKAAALAREQQVTQAEGLRQANERISNVRTVRIFSQEEAEIKAYSAKLLVAQQSSDRYDSCWLYTFLLITVQPTHMHCCSPESLLHMYSHNHLHAAS